MGVSREEVLAKIPPASRRVPYWLSYLKPPDRLSISQWADHHRHLTSTDSAETGLWHTLAYQVEPQDAIGDPWTEQVVLMWASQTGKTAGPILNALGFFIDIDPCPILLVLPTISMGERVSRQRVSPLIRNCPSLREKVYKTTWRKEAGSDSLLLKTFAGGQLIIGGAEKPASLSSFPMRVVLMDEIDRYKADVGDEGDAVQLAKTRTSTFWNRKIILASTPTIKGESRIELAYDASSRGRWQLPCPGCGIFQTLYWKQIDYSSYGGRVLCRCQACQEAFSKARWLSSAGKWVHEDPANPVKGYHLNALVSEWVKWEDLVAEWLSANEAKRQGNIALLKVFINTRLCETFEEYSVRVSTHLLYDRRELYQAEVPDGVLVLTCGVDVQDIQKRINFEVVGWGKGYESWGILYGTILADPREEEWHAILDEQVYNRLFELADGRQMRVRKTFIDANGSIGPYVYKYTKRRQPRVYSIKGMARDLPQMGSFCGGVKIDLHYNASWIPVNTVMGKDELFQRLMLEEPGPGYCHFPMGVNEDAVRGYDNGYFQGLTSESKRESVNNSGFVVMKYSKLGASRTPGEALDCRNYSRAALELVEQSTKLEKMAGPDCLKPATEVETSSQNSHFYPQKPVENTPKGIVLGTPVSQKGAKPHPMAAKFGQFGTRQVPFDPFSN